MSEILRCSDCDSIVELCRSEKNTLLARCDCIGRSIRVSKALPDGWNE